jgi:hypothetical protein
MRAWLNLALDFSQRPQERAIDEVSQDSNAGHRDGGPAALAGDQPLIPA